MSEDTYEDLFPAWKTANVFKTEDELQDSNELKKADEFDAEEDDEEEDDADIYVRHMKQQKRIDIDTDYAEQQDLKRFFEVLYQDSPKQYYTCLTTFPKLGGPPNSNTFSHLNDFEALAKIAHKKAQQSGYSVYFRPSVVQQKPKSGRGTEADTTGSSVLYVDIDYYQRNLTEQEVVLKLDSLPQSPSIIIHSGRGIQCYWLLDTFYTDIQRLKSCNFALAEQLLDYGADHCGDFARILRLPLSYNQKTTPPTPVRILEIHEDRKYTLSSFPVSVQTEEIAHLELIDLAEEAIPDSFLDDIKALNKDLHDRIFSEATAAAAGAQMKQQVKTVNGRKTSTESVDQSKNDWAIACGLLKLGYTPGVVLSVLQHKIWFSGSKSRSKLGSFSYTNKTVTSASEHVRRDPGKYFTKDKKLNLHELVNTIDQHTPFALVGGKLYYFETGVYRVDGESKIRTEVLWRLGDQWKSSYRNEVIEKITDIATERKIDLYQLPGRKNLDELWVNTKSGLVNLGTGDLRKSLASDKQITQLPVYYDVSAVCDEIDQALAQILPADAIAAFWEYVGYCLLTDLRFRKALGLFGEKRSGKSTLLELLMYFFGAWNISNISLQDLCDSRFSGAQLLGKFANIYSDLDTTTIKNPGLFKMYVSGDSIKGEFKFKDEFYFYPTAGHIYSANDYTALVQPDDAYMDRWLVIKTSNQFIEKSRQPESGQFIAEINLMNKLTTQTELSGMLNRALEGLRRLMKNECFSEGQSMKDAHDEMHASIDSVFAFLATQTAQNFNAKIKKTEILEAYKSWCAFAGKFPVSERKFYSRIKTLLHKFSMREGHINIDNHQIHMYEGRELITDGAQYFIITQ